VKDIKDKLDIREDVLTDNQKEMINKKLEDSIKFMDGVKADRAGKQLF
jgi:hypothetical protein